jgi:hypothetical protein
MSEERNRTVKIPKRQLEADRARFRKDHLPGLRAEREKQLRELARFARDLTPLATLARVAGWRQDQPIVEFIAGLEYQAQTAEQAKFLSALLAAVASGNDARKLLGIPNAKRGHKGKLPHLSAAVHEIEALASEGDGFEAALRRVAGIVGEPVENLRRVYFREKKLWSKPVKGAYAFKAARFGIRRRGDKS